jgi:hypothetical protein
MSEDLASQYNRIITEFFNTRLNPSRLQGFLKSAGEHGLQVAKSQCPVKTGRLRDGNQIEVSANGNTPSLHFFNEVEYGPYVNYGTSRMSPRPFFDAGTEAIKQKLNQELSQI